MEGVLTVGEDLGERETGGQELRTTGSRQTISFHLLQITEEFCPEVIAVCVCVCVW